MKIKGFDKNLKWRGMKFEVGGTYDTGADEANLELYSDTVFRYGNSLQDVYADYAVNPSTRFCEIEVLGKEVSNGDLCGSNKIRIVREIVGEELDILKGRINDNSGLFNSGDWNSGKGNSGHGNSGDWNSGFGNSGKYNSGYWNSGIFNSCDRSAGVFCSKPEKIRIFNMPSDMTAGEFYDSEYYIAITSVPLELTVWHAYKDDEMDTPMKRSIGGWLETIPYKEACAKWWAAMSDENKDIIMSMPNFDAAVFKEITGIVV